MKLLKIRRLVSFITCFSLVLQTLLPFTLAMPAYAEDNTATDSSTVASTPVIAQESALGGSDSAAIQTPEITPESTPAPVQTVDDKTATFDSVSVGQTYTSKDGKATVTFSEITADPGNLVIKEITLTPEQIAQSGAVSEVAYDITSNMADGTFKYDLSLPKPADQNIEVKYSEDGQNFVTSGGVSTTDNEVVVSNVNHFTIFVVTGGNDTTATDFFGQHSHTLNASEISALSVSDNIRYGTDDYWPTSWNSDYQKNQFVEFTFNTNIPTGSTITNNATLTFEYQRDEFMSGSNRKVEIRAWNSNDFNTVIGTDNELEISNPNTDKSVTLSIPYGLINTPAKANAFKIRFYMYGTGNNFPIYGIKTRFDYVGLNINYTLPDTTKPVIGAVSNITREVVGLSSSVVNYNLPTVTDNVSTGLVATCLPASGSTFAYGTTTVTCNAKDAANNSADPKTFTVTLRDTTAPTATVAYSTTAPTNGSVIATITPSETVIVTSENASLTHSFSANGTFTFTFKDLADNTGSVVATVSNIDKTAPDAPSLISPDNGVYRHTSDTNYSEWGSVTDANMPITYYYQSAFDAGFTNIAYPRTAQPGTKIFNPGEPEGTYYWRVQACDSVGNCSPWSSRSINIDNTLPTVPTNGKPNGSIIPTNNFDFTWDAAIDNSPLTYEFQSSQNSAQTNGVLTAGLWKSDILPTNMIHSSGAPDGVWYWQVRAIDKAGNVGAWSPIWRVTLDTLAPSVPVLTWPISGTSTNDNTPLMQWNDSTDTGSGVSGYYYRVYYHCTNPSDFSTCTSVYPSSLGQWLTASEYQAGMTSDGVYYWQVSAQDVAGNQSGWSGAEKVTIDTVNPVITVAPYITTWTNQDITVTASVNEGTLNATSHTFTANGSFTFTAIDAANNSSSQTVTITNIDKALPLVSADNSSASWKNVMFNVTLSASDSTGSGINIAKYSWDSVATETVGSDFVNGNTISPLQGSHTLYLYAKDKAGNASSWSGTYLFDSIAPNAPLLNTPVDGFITKGVAFSQKWYSVSDAVLYKYESCNSDPGDLNATCSNVKYTENFAGLTKNVGAGQPDSHFWWRVSAKDIAGNWSVWSESRELIIDNTPPALSEKTVFEGWYNTDKVSEFTYTDQYGIASGTPVSCVISSEGANQTCSVTPRVCDVAGNCNIQTATSNGANIDKTNPIVGISWNPVTPDASNGWYKTQPEATISVVDANPMILQYQWDSQTGSWLDYVLPVKPATEGEHTLYFRATDKAGNESGISSSIVKWDQTELESGPLNVSADPNPTSGSTSKIKWEAAKDNIGIDKYEIRWYLNGGTSSQDHTATVGPDIREQQIDQLVEGRWTVSVRAFDTAGHSKDATVEVNVDRTGPAAPALTLTGTGVGTASLSWTAIPEAVDYIVWYGTTPGGRLFGARVGNNTSYTVRGLGAGNYYFVVKAVDSAQNQGSESNEVNTGTIQGAAGVLPGTPAEGFTPEVLGTNTDSTPSSQVTPEVKGASTDEKGFNWWWLLLLLIPLYFGVRKASKKH